MILKEKGKIGPQLDVNWELVETHPLSVRFLLCVCAFMELMELSKDWGQIAQDKNELVTSETHKARIVGFQRDDFRNRNVR